IEDAVTAARTGMAATMQDNGVDAAMLVAVSADQHAGEGAAAAAAEALAAHGIAMLPQLWTEAITTGSRWASAELGKAGALPDPQASELAAAVAFDGKAIHRNRDEVAAELAPTGIPVGATAADG